MPLSTGPDRTGFWYLWERWASLEWTSPWRPNPGIQRRQVEGAGESQHGQVQDGQGSRASPEGVGDWTRDWILT